MKQRGRFIVIEGTDGSGKATQVKLLVRALKKAGYKIKYVDFPQYGKPSARLVERYLNGAMGLASSISPYDASLFYAVDRFASGHKLRQWFAQGYTVVANRFTWSNAAHQGGKLNSLAARKKFWKWLFRLEYHLLDIPWPNITVVLHVPAAQAQQLVDKKGRRAHLGGARRDAHEADLAHLKAAEQAYLTLAKTHRAPVIECVEKGRLLTPAEIHKKVLAVVLRRM